MSQHYPHVSNPLKGANCFMKIGEQHSPAQAAVLLMLGRQLRGDDAATTARARGRTVRRALDVTGLSDDSEFPVPKLKLTTLRSVSAERATSITARYGAKATWEKKFHSCADDLFAKSTLEAAANLMELSLDHPIPLVRIAAAAAYFPIAKDGDRLIAILAGALKSPDELERDVAATALARIQPDHARLAPLVRFKIGRRVRRKPQTLLMVHGTWAASGTWWQQGGDFHTFIHQLRNDLYSLPDRYAWTGGYSDGARSAAALTLEQWVNDRNEQGLDLISHSHGGSVMMLATANGMKAGRMILLSCPVHVDKYFPDFANCGEVHSVRVKLDLVILADRGGQRFRHPGISENILPIWFDHSASHDPGVWQAHQIATKVGL